MLYETTCIHTYVSTPVHTYLPQQVLKPKKGWRLFVLLKHVILPLNACIFSYFLKGTRETFSKPTQDPNCFDMGIDPWDLGGEVKGRKANPLPT